MNHLWLFLMFATSLLLAQCGIIQAQQVYKWTDARGQVHYGEKKPEAADQVQTLDIRPPPPVDSSNPDVTDEVARLNALSEQMANERQAAEKARQEQVIRDLEQQNKALENELLNQQLDQLPSNDDRDRTIITYPPIYPYPYYPPNYPPPYPPRPPYPPHHRPCQPWPACNKPVMQNPPPRPAPLVKPKPPRRVAPAGLAPTTQGGFWGR